MVVDLLRSCYTARMRLHPGDPTRLTTVQWYWAPPGAECFPGMAPASLNWTDGARDVPPGVPGETESHRRPWRDGSAPSTVYRGRRYCGRLDWYSRGVPLDAPLPVRDRNGVPACCQPRTWDAGWFWGGRGGPVEAGSGGLTTDGAGVVGGLYYVAGAGGLAGGGVGVASYASGYAGGGGLLGDGAGVAVAGYPLAGGGGLAGDGAGVAVAGFPLPGGGGLAADGAGAVIGHHTVLLGGGLTTDGAGVAVAGYLLPGGGGLSTDGAGVAVGAAQARGGGGLAADGAGRAAAAGSVRGAGGLAADGVGAPVGAWVRAGRGGVSMDGSGRYIGSWVRAGGGGLAADGAGTAVGDEVVPTGTILAFGGSVLPAGYLWCDGSAVSRTTYAALLAALTRQFAGDTTSGLSKLDNMTMPDLCQIGPTKGKIEGPGWSSPTGVSGVVSTARVNTTTNATSTQTGGTHTLYPHGNGDGSTTFNVPDLTGRTPVGLGGAAVGTNPPQLGEPGGNAEVALSTNNLPAGVMLNTGPAVLAGGGAVTVTVTGAGSAHNNVSPCLACRYIIKT